MKCVLIFLICLCSLTLIRGQRKSITSQQVTFSLFNNSLPNVILSSFSINNSVIIYYNSSERGLLLRLSKTNPILVTSINTFKLILGSSITNVFEASFNPTNITLDLDCRAPSNITFPSLRPSLDKGKHNLEFTVSTRNFGLFNQSIRIAFEFNDEEVSLSQIRQLSDYLSSIFTPC